MTAETHYRVVCDRCAKVVRQCRCAGPKVVTKERCVECSNESYYHSHPAPR